MADGNAVVREVIKYMTVDNVKLTAKNQRALHALCAAQAYEAVSASGKAHKDAKYAGLATEAAHARAIHGKLEAAGCVIPPYMKNAACYNDVSMTKPYAPSATTSTLWE